MTEKPIEDSKTTQSNFWYGTLGFLFSNKFRIPVFTCSGLYYLLQYLYTDESKSGFTSMFSFYVVSICIAEEYEHSLKNNITALKDELQSLKKQFADFKKVEKDKTNE